jgi:antitoxin (DNA-binding transcriptional repressor) of toxin-antitoxin stability system
MDEAVDVEEAINNLSRAGRSIARIVPFKARVKPRKPGIWKGRVWASPDFDEPLRDIEDAFGL